MLAACGDNKTTEFAEELKENAAADIITMYTPETATDSKAPLEEEDEQLCAAPLEKYINTCLNELSLEEKIGQMFICAFRDNKEGVWSINDTIKDVIAAYHLGGAILFNENLHDKAQTKNFIADLQNDSNIPLFIAIDEEGGAVSRLGALGYERLPSASRIGSSGDSSMAFEQGSKIALNLKELGFNLDFAPVADISSNKRNTVIGARAFSDDPQIAAAMVQAFVRGLQEGGIIATLKHFPGHGGANGDTHYGPASIPHNMDMLKEKDLLPFQTGIDAGAGFVMVGHVSAPHVTGNDEAAIFSKKIVTSILREQMGFTGVIITDALDMGAVIKKYRADEAAVKAILAGVDILLMPQDLNLAFNGVLEAVASGEISESRLDESLSRILKMKARFGILESAW
jgi:beta-N-acetylhexosaminidase